MAEEAVELDQGGLGRTTKDLMSGAAGGIAQVLIGQPFDIIKVRLQTTTQYPSALNCFRSILTNEGPLAFYKGTLTPLIGIGACVSVQFGAFHWTRRQLEAGNLSRSSSSPNPTGQLSYAQFWLAGAAAGIANTPLSAPIEHVRIRLQAQPHGAGRLYSGPLDCVGKLSAHAGVLRGVYRGAGVTAFREAFAYGAWFTAFEFMMNSDARRNGIARKEVGGGKVALYGGLAGEALWLASYPFDVVKSKLQTDGLGGEARYKGAVDCAGQVWRESGWRGFWRGIGPTLARAMPVSAGTFAVVEATMRALD